MKNKILKILVCIFLIITLIAPVKGEFFRQSVNTIQNTSFNPLNSTVFDEKISLIMKIAGFPSLATCIIKDNQIVWSKGYGYYDISNQKPATVDTVYILASITKTIVGTAIMQLYEKELFDLDDDVNVFLPFDLRNPNFLEDPITFRMLLSHTSSLNTNAQ